MRRDHFIDLNAVIGDVTGFVLVVMYSPGWLWTLALVVPGAAAGYVVGFNAAKGVVIAHDLVVWTLRMVRKLGVKAWRTGRSRTLATAVDSQTRK